MHHVQVKMFIALRRRCHTFTVFAFPVFPLTPFGEKKQHKGTPDLPQLLKNKGVIMLRFGTIIVTFTIGAAEGVAIKTNGS